MMETVCQIQRHSHQGGKNIRRGGFAGCDNFEWGSWAPQKGRKKRELSCAHDRRGSRSLIAVRGLREEKRWLLLFQHGESRPQGNGDLGGERCFQTPIFLTATTCCRKESILCWKNSNRGYRLGGKEGNCVGVWGEKKCLSGRL